MSSAVAVEHLADDRRHLRRADVEPDQIPLFSRHSASGVSARLPRRPTLSLASASCRAGDFAGLSAPAAGRT